MIHPVNFTRSETNTLGRGKVFLTNFTGGFDIHISTTYKFTNLIFGFCFFNTITIEHHIAMPLLMA